MTNDALRDIRTRGTRTPQRAQADPRQEKNSAGGYVFVTDGETRIRRFLTMGTYGTFYVNTRDTTADNGGVLLDWAKNRSSRLVELTAEISVAGRAPRNGPALLALAAALSLGDVEGRRAAALALPSVARTGSHLETLAGYAEQFGGWGPVTRRAFASWYLDKDPDRLAYQLIKYRRRGGGDHAWSHADILKMAHPKPRTADGTLMTEHDALFGWLCGKGIRDDGLPKWVVAYRRAQEIAHSTGSPAAKYVALIGEYPGLPWEALGDEATGQADVWRALIDAGMPVTALIRNLPKMTRLGVLAPMSSHLRAVCEQLADADALKRQRVHPVAILVAAKVYASGRSEKGTSTWTPVPQVTDALSRAFYLAFPAVEPAGKRTMVALDVSGSMTSSAAGYCLSAREVVAAMALVTMNTEPSWGVYGFSTQFMPLQLSPGMRLDTAARYMAGLPYGGTDCSLPMRWALANRVEVDTFQVWSDYETWAGSEHAYEALRNYRQGMGIGARMQTVMVTPTKFALANPDDAGTLDVSGFDSDVPVLLANHARGDI